jgi:Uncharacterized protein conserved in bacteria
MQMNPYLTFKGQCEAAFKFYEQVLGGKIVAMIRTRARRPPITCRPNGAARSCMPAWSWTTKC